MLAVAILGGEGLSDDEIVAEVDERDGVGGFVGHVVFLSLEFAEDGAGVEPGCVGECLAG